MTNKQIQELAQKHDVGYTYHKGDDHPIHLTGFLANIEAMLRDERMAGKFHVDRRQGCIALARW